VITLSDLIFKIMLPFFGFTVGIGVGQDYWGVFGAILGAVLGFFLFAYLGSILDSLFLRFTIRQMRKQFAPLSVSELRSQLITSLTPNHILLELKARGEDISKDIEPVLQLLEADESPRRCRGWAALLSAFPQSAASIRGYNPMRPVSECHKKVEELRHQFETSHSPHCA
jgi:hypothetical protein